MLRKRSSRPLSDLRHTKQIIICSIQGQIAVLGIALQSALLFQVTTKPMRYLMHQLCQFSPGGFIGSKELGSCTVATAVAQIQNR